MTEIDRQARMKRPPCTQANSLLEGDLKLAAEHDIVEQLQVMETKQGFYVLVHFADKARILEKHKSKGLPEWFYVLAQLLATPGKDWYLTTRRDRKKPRLFKDLKRLNDFLIEQCPTNGFILLRHQALPGRAPRKTAMKRSARTTSTKQSANLPHVS